MKLLSSSQEDYLETILGLANEGAVCVRDIAKRMNVSMPSVTGAMRRLEKMGLVSHGRYDYVELTKSGRIRAESVAGRHALLMKFLTDVLGLSPKIAQKDACEMEHSLSEATVKAIVEYME